MKIDFTENRMPDEGVVVVGVLEDRRFCASAAALDHALAGSLTRAVAGSRFTGKRGQTLTIIAPPLKALDRIVLLGLGSPADLDALKLQAIGGQMFAALATAGPASAVVAVDPVDGCAMPAADMAAQMAFGASLRAYRFSRYLTKEKEEDKPALGALVFGCDQPARAREVFAPLDSVREAVFFCRDLVSEPANVVYPESLAKEAKSLKSLGVDVHVLDEKEMRALGMNALLGVGQGSARESLMVVMEWWGAGRPDSDEKKGKDKHHETAAAGDAADINPLGPLAIIGKGVTFDTGGISIKPSANMEDMKWDMAGAAAVIAAMRALALRKAKANVVGVVGLVENMPSSTAQRPGDVVTSLSGQTIEVINTDAEGRLVLCDCITYTKQTYKPRMIIDLATLTGAVIIALGHEKAAIFANDDKLAERLIAAGAAVGEPLWRLPLDEEYDKLIKSDIADMKNVGDRSAGSITAAQFLQRFVGKTPWAHLDIAGVAWAKKDKDTTPKGATAFGVRLLDRFVADYCECR